MKKFSFLYIAKVWIRIYIGFRNTKIFCIVKIIITCEETSYGIGTGTVHTVK
jgi:hypothetical protein